MEPDLTAAAGVLDDLLVWARRTAPPGVSISAISALGVLDHAGPVRVSDLAAREGMSQPGMTTLVHRLVEAGWAERAPDPTDGRATLVRITPAGRALRAHRRDQRTAALLERLHALPAEHRAAIRAAVPALARLTADAGAAGESARPATLEATR